MSVLTLFSTGVFAQKTIENKPDEPYQKTLRLEGVNSREKAIAEFSKLYGLDQNNTFEAKKETSDPSGMVHQRNQQFYKGLKIEFGTLITHARDGFVEMVNGELYDAKNLNITPTLSKEQGFDKAVGYVGAKSYLWDDTFSAANVDYKKPTGELLIFPKVISGTMHLAYKYDIYATEPLARDEVYVDAHTGEILYVNPIIKHLTSIVSKQQLEETAKKVEEIITGTIQNKAAYLTGSAATRYSGVRNIETTQLAPSNFVLWDQTRGGGIQTFNSENTNTFPTTDFTNTTNTWNSGNYAATSTTRDNAALDAHWGAEMTYDFWKNTFNRNSFDDNGALMKSYVHFNNISGSTTGWDNASWDGAQMRYGDGNTFKILTALDVCGHEIGHAVCSYTANLAYQNQSGAMNEGFSDIWGTCVEQYGRNGNLNAPVDTASPGSQAVWKIGEDLATSPLRSMSYPLTRGNPDTFLGTSYADTQDDSGAAGTVCNTPGQNTNDWCGVHNNSGVLNHWFYILTAGKAGTNNASVANGGPDVYNVTGIGMTKSSQIAYYTERDYLTANAKFVDARNGSIAVASSLYCASSPEVQAVTKAWFAVNVGADYTALANDIVLKSISGGNASVACGATFSPSIVMENGGSSSIAAATITYNIDGGANSTINWTGSMANCNQATQAISVSGLTRGYHTLNVTVTTAGDGNATNNTKSLAIVVNDAGTVNVINTFNTAADVLVSIDANGKTNTVWQRGTLSGKTNLTNALAGSQVYATRLTSANYSNGDHAYLVSQCYNLTGYTNPTVSFDMAFDLELNYDFINLEYSTDSGATWNILGNSFDTNWYNSNRVPGSADCDSCPGAQWTGLYATGPTAAQGGTGVNGNKRSYSHTLAPFGFGGATPASNIIFRFNFFADGGVNQQGVFVDNFVIQGVLSRPENQFSQFAVYPNPSKGIFNIELSTNEKVGVQLYDMRGRSVYQKTFDAEGTTFNKQIDLSSLSSGVYILNVESAGKKEGKRIIIE